MFREIIDGIRNMGASSLLPIAVIFLSLCFRIKIGKAIRSGFLIGAGFTGISLIVQMMNTQLGTAAQAMSERLGLNLSVVDVGWQGASPMAWASSLSAIAIPIAILVNVVMLGCKLTRTVNIDIWNIWHIIFTGALAYTVTGKLWIGILGIVVHSIVVYKLGDLWAPFIEDYFELSGLTVPHGTAAYMAPVACLVELVIEKIPGINKIDFSIDKLQEKAGGFAEPVMMGGIIGFAIGILAGYRIDKAFSIGIEMAAVMVLMPQIVKCIMEGLLPLSERIKQILSKRFGDGTYSLGLDPSLLLGDSQVVTAGLLFIPLTLVIAMFMPQNQVLPFGDLATISFFIAISVAIHKGNLFRTLISGSLIMYLTIWISNQTIPWVTAFGKQTGTLDKIHKVAAMDQGGSPITYLYVELFERKNAAGAVGVGIFYGICILSAVRCYKKRKKENEMK